MDICSYFVLMPEPYWPKRKNAYTLSDAMKHSELALIRCSHCKTERYYLLRDLRTLFGDIECDDVVYQQSWRCTQCGRVRSLDIDLVNIPAAERRGIKVRRLVRVDYIRRPVWQDE